MKITKYQLLILLSELMFYISPINRSVGDIDFIKELQVKFEKVKAVFDSLKKDELEIEGYERVKWHKFDPNDESTFPPENGEYLVLLYGKIVRAEWWRALFMLNDHKNRLITHWRPRPTLPPPHVETEEAK